MKEDFAFNLMRILFALLVMVALTFAGYIAYTIYVEQREADDMRKRFPASPSVPLK